jgi:hypothetical protein
MNKITFHGNKKSVMKAQAIIGTIENAELVPEPILRTTVQDLIDKYSLRATIMINENRVWSRKRILKNLNQIMKHGKLYDKRKPKYYPIGSLLKIPAGGKPVLSQYFYEFLHLECGTIAHYNIQGWICVYPTLEHLKKFFLKNEHRKRVADWIPSWKTDAKRIVEAIEQQLFPLQSYMRYRRKI